MPSLGVGGWGGVFPKARCSPRLRVWTMCEVKFVEIHISQLDEQMQQKQMNG